MKSEKNNMHIRYAVESDRSELYRLWQRCFYDTDMFTDYYFDRYFRENKVLMLEYEGSLKAMLHLNPYTFSVCRHKLDSYYIVGVATDENYRHRGAMTELLKYVFVECYAASMPFVYLMPADEAIYRPMEFAYIYAQCVEKKKFCIEEEHQSSITCRPAESWNDLKLIADMANEALNQKYDIYTWRDEHYFKRLQQENRVDGGDLLMLYSDHAVIGYLSYAQENEVEGREVCVLAEYRQEAACWLMEYFDEMDGEFLPLSDDGFMEVPEQANRYERPIIMGRIINLYAWMQLMPVQNTPFNINIQIEDQWIEANNGIWQWSYEDGIATFEKKDCQADVSMKIDTLMQWLTGYRRWEDLVKDSTMTLIRPCGDMLCKILTLKNALINEIV